MISFSTCIKLQMGFLTQKDPGEWTRKRRRSVWEMWRIVQNISADGIWIESGSDDLLCNCVLYVNLSPGLFWEFTPFLQWRCVWVLDVARLRGLGRSGRWVTDCWGSRTLVAAVTAQQAATDHSKRARSPSDIQSLAELIPTNGENLNVNISVNICTILVSVAGKFTLYLAKKLIWFIL